jgi:hypothetical protein
MNKLSKNYYTYAYLRENNSQHGKRRTPYYIGKGTKNRMYKTNGRCCGVPADKNLIVILKSGLNEEEAFKWEEFYIQHYGRQDLGTGILRNKSNGGEGASGKIWSEESKNKQRQNMIDRLADPQRATKLQDAIKKSASNPIRNAQISQKKKEFWADPGNRASMSKTIATWVNSPDGKRKLGAARVKVLYQIIDPDGEVYCTHSMRDFCRQYSLSPTCMGRVVNGKAHSHFGWTAKIIECYK